MNKGEASTPTTEYKKVVVVPPKKHLSKPKNAERAMVINLIVDGLMPSTERTAWKANNQEFINSLLLTPNISYLRKILDLVPYAVQPKDSRFIIDEASSYHRRDFDSLHANREFLGDGVGMERLKEVAESLSTLGYKRGTHIPSVLSHLAAEDVHYSSLVRSGSSIDEILFPSLEDTYYGSDLCPLVEEFHTEIDMIIDTMTNDGIVNASGLRHLLQGSQASLAGGAL